MTSELRPAVEVWRDASDAATLGSVKYKPAADKAAAAVIEADREAVRSEVVREIVTWLRDEARGPYFADLIEAKFGASYKEARDD